MNVLDATLGDDAALANVHVVSTEAPLAPRHVRAQRAQVLFETYGVASLHTAPPALFASVSRRVRRRDATHSDEHTVHSADVSLVIDCGYSCTWIVPLYDGRVLDYAVRRVDVGGKVLTNYLKELITARHFDVSDETRLVEDVRKRMCYVARDFEQELRTAAAERRGGALRQRFLLPDYVETTHGRVLDADERVSGDVAQVLTLANERITVPEVLLRPSDVGIQQAGIAEATAAAIAACPESLAPALFASIELVGGCAQTTGLVERLRAELRALAPCDVDVCVDLAPEPTLAAWRGAAFAAQQAYVEKQRVTKAEYEERGGRQTIVDRKELHSARSLVN